MTAFTIGSFPYLCKMDNTFGGNFVLPKTTFLAILYAFFTL